MIKWIKYAPYFYKEEFDCRCGCGKNDMKESTMDKLLIARTSPKILESGVRFGISSGDRCLIHNEREGGGVRSTHPRGFAIDTKVYTHRMRYLILFSLYEAGFERFGLHQDFVHADDCADNDKNQEVLWLYP